MNEEDTEFWQTLLELTGKKEWQAFMEDIEAQQKNMENRMLNAEDWESFLEARGQYRMLNYLVNLRDFSKFQLGIEE